MNTSCIKLSQEYESKDALWKRCYNQMVLTYAIFGDNQYVPKKISILYLNC